MKKQTKEMLLELKLNVLEKKEVCLKEHRELTKHITQVEKQKEHLIAEYRDASNTLKEIEKVLFDTRFMDDKETTIHLVKSPLLAIMLKKVAATMEEIEELKK